MQSRGRAGEKDDARMMMMMMMKYSVRVILITSIEAEEDGA
jgi:hypothetical protein